MSDALEVLFKPFEELDWSIAEFVDFIVRERECARAEAERTLESRDNLLAFVAHELRTPLNAITGWAQIIAAGGVDAKTLDRGISVIIRNAKAQERIISDLYEASSILTGKFSLSLKPLNLSKLLADEIETVMPVAENKRIQIKKHFENINLAVYADEGRIRQVICNLLNNAVKFTPQSGSINIWCGIKDDLAQITVSDTGCGIKPETLPQVFERSFQAGCGNGLGLGLTIARYIIEQHNGKISAESQGVNQGATFTVRLPGVEVY